MQTVKLLYDIKYHYIKLMQVFYHHKVINTLIMEKHQERYHSTMRSVLTLKKLCALKCILNYLEDQVIIYMEFINN